MGSNDYAIRDLLDKHRRSAIASYWRNPGLLPQHLRLETQSYGVLGPIRELVQHAVDALHGRTDRQISAILAPCRERNVAARLYVAHDGDQFAVEDLRELLEASLALDQEGAAPLSGIMTVAGIADRLDFFSTSGSFYFDRDQAASDIAKVLNGKKRSPLLRIAYFGSVKVAASRDNVLAELGPWASTVVRLAVRSEAVDVVAQEIRALRTRSWRVDSHVGTLVLEDRRGSTKFTAELPIQPATKSRPPIVRVLESSPSQKMASPSTSEAIDVAGEILASSDESYEGSRSLPALLADEFPYLRVLASGKIKGWSVVRCADLAALPRATHNEQADPRFIIKGHSILVRNTDDDNAVLRAVNDGLGLALDDEALQAVIAHRRQERSSARMQQARRQPDDAQKLAVLLDEGIIRSALPATVLKSESMTTGSLITAQRAAELVIHRFGSDVLRHFKEALAEVVPYPIGKLEGGRVSRNFVADIGFAESFAGVRPTASGTQRSLFAPVKSTSLPVSGVAHPPSVLRTAEPAMTLPFGQGRRHPRVEYVHGPSEYAGLHDYQEVIVNRMVDLIRGPRPDRAMLSLPTGAGKTRVACEAVTRVLRYDHVKGPVLWIAQTEELCEQAVDCWKFVWSKVGPPERLTISRLWGGNPATPALDGPHLVVTIDATLRTRLDRPEYAWLRDAAVVIVDEAHRSITPTYTRMFKSLGLTRSTTERPLIGLTATPYRNRNKEETQRLIDHYGEQRLDDGVFDSDPYVALQDLGILARVKQKLLSGGQLTLRPDELNHVRLFRSLPPSAESRLGQDKERNERLLREIANLPKSWPVLLFATSVDHAHWLAADLNERGIAAASIDGSTPKAQRRAQIERFREGHIQVLTNYGVLAQGFDAPATRAVVVARPTYSPNVYQQMIGRGLRGPKNGGKDTCLILNIQDNFTNYGEALAFTEFEYLWHTRR